MKLAGFHAVVRWHWSQTAVVGIWPLFFPVAVEPLWHVAHEPAVTEPWLKLAGFHAVVRWHWSQAAVVGMWPLFLPVAVDPL